MAVDKDKFSKMFACSKESHFDLLGLIHKKRFVGLRNDCLYIIKEQNGKKIIKHIYELKRLFKLVVKVNDSIIARELRRM